MSNLNYKKRKNHSYIRLIIIIAVVIAALLIAIKFVQSFNSDKKISKNDTKIETNVSKNGENDKTKADDSSDSQDSDAADEKSKEEPQIDPTSQKPGTSHNYEAEAWAYSCKDVNNWILNPSTYTGTDKLVFLTFDDGPSSSLTPIVLDTLKNYGVHGTFFIVGRSADQDYAKPLLEREMKEGHAVGLHSYTHEYSNLYPNRVGSVENVLAEIDQNMKAIRKSLGEDFKTTIFRYPGGHMSWKGLTPVDEALAQQNIYNIDWNVLTGDAEAKGSRRDLQGALDNIKEDMAMYGGSPKVVVVLMHDIKQKSVDALPQIIEYYNSLGYKFGILS
ncbi:MAG: polysaccharide deacetylase family protein [Peptoanaerobacter stomatis]|uniref:polysaccharide deacetylase family protein n=1 Tax=Peptoanaerobacter stomatis TaxID=796937 RepID=UPI003F9FC87B